MQYQIKRGNIVVLTVTAPGKQQRQAMGVDVVNMSFSLPNSVNINIGDTVEVYGRVYKLNRPANVTKISNKQYDYTLEFEALFYDLAKVQLRGLDATNQLTEAEFTIMANAADIVDLIVRNANRLYSGYTIGVVDETELQNFIFNGENCLQALNRLADAFQSEFWIDNKTIHFQKREQSTGVVLSYGQGNGLYQLYRGKKSDADLVTRLYVEGGSRNLPEGYGRTRLQLPGPLNYIEVAGADEIIEATKIFENIIPERVGTITGLGADMFTFIDSSMDFDINDHLSGKPAKIGFQTGALAGYEFELASYNAVSKQFKINLKTDEKAYEDGLPNHTLKPAVGDKYSVFDIYLPNSYVVDAQNRALAAGQAYLDKYKNVQYEYGASLTPIWVKQNNPNIVLGYTVQIVDADMGIDKEIRIVGYTRDLQEPNTYDLELGDTISISEIVRQYAQQERILYAIQTAGLLDPEQMRKNLFLNRLSENNGYLIIGTEKVKSGLADYATLAARATLADYALDSDKWDGQQFADYLNQPVRTMDSPKFEGISSPLFVSGAFGSGYRVSKSGGKYTLELDNLVVRDGFTATELTINKIRSSNGAIAVTDAGVIKTVQIVDLGQFEITLDGDVSFLQNDILRCQVFTGTGIKSYHLLVLGVSGSVISVAKIQGSNSISTGDTIVRVGNISNTDRQGLLYLTNSDSGAPYLDVLDGVNSASFAGKTKVRLGKLSGIVDPDFGALSGYGIYAERGFFKGSIQVTGGNAATKSYAETQANNAQITAINTAATDATNKVNALQIGGRNLLAYSNVRKEGNSYPFGIYNIYGGTTFGKEYTLVVNGYTTVGDNIGIYLNGYQTIGSISSQDESNIQVFHFTRNDSGVGTNVDFYHFTNGSSGNSVVEWACLYEGNVKPALDWSPSPEDVQADIEAVRTETNTQFSVLESQISAKASQVSVSALETRMSSAELKITPEAINLTVSSQVDNKIGAVQIGGRNYYRRNTVLDPMYGGTIVGRDSGETPNGFLFAGLQNQSLALRINNVITEDGFWTISFSAKSNSDWTLYIDVCDNPADSREITQDWQYYELTFNVTRNGYSFVDFSNIPWVYLYVKDLKIEKGTKATDFSLAPEDIQADIESRPTQAEIKAGISITPGAINIFGQELSLAGKVTFSSLDAGAQNQIDAIAQAKANTLLWMGGKSLYPDTDFREGFNGLNHYNNAGPYGDFLRLPKESFGEIFPTTSPYGLYYHYNSATMGGSAPGLGGFTFGTGSRPKAKYIVRFVLAFEEENKIQFASNPTGDGGSHTWLTNPYGAGINNFREYLCLVECGATGTFSSTNYFYFYGGSSVSVRVASAGVYDITDSPTALKSLAYQDVVEISKLGNTVIQGGYLATSLLDANYIKSNIVNAAYIQTIDLTADKITAGRLQSVGGGSYFDLNNNVLSTSNLIANGGTIAGFTIDGYSLSISKTYGSNSTAFFRLLTSGEITGLPTLLIGSRFLVGQNVIQQNQLLVDKDGCYLRDANIDYLSVGSVKSNGYTGLTATFTVRDGNDHWWLVFQNGILVNRYKNV
ncbi:hypothetical protein Pedsa_0939 [Pseudopedobacter saltans DSM 12145]|uniref:Uncharacterized protein n=1 Tax=Pseudopedobacter saltans (strain ATCC 51119 / DSM 12145 / JCM 21818 / CCUG 39354 / LMG 10337 / NBRC 100064 / NCIMB 13643) TaxID=762903 RepID=F0SAD4_PSESL|nr:phage tail protein [Pseudopedobacter saltans]ADY51511.1 hypothetical protein Pedsa_0939 [Pseudopedobacter saltans DSM 12145]